MDSKVGETRVSTLPPDCSSASSRKLGNRSSWYRTDPSKFSSDQMVKLRKFLQALGRRASSLGNKIVGRAKKFVGLNAVPDPHGFMKLPQELVDHILYMLRDDCETLRACSLTCKALLYSTRPLTHHTLHLTQRTRGSFTKAKTFSCMRPNRDGARLYFLSYMGKRGLLQHARRVNISLPRVFTPNTLLPHLHYFQTLNRVHTLTIKHYDAVLWANHHKTCFAHFYPTLTSLSLCHPSGRFPFLLQFALQFPNLEDLSLEWLKNEEQVQTDLTVPAIIHQSPPLRGRFRLAGVYPEELFNELRKKMNFRSVELDRPSHAQHVLDACADTLENLTIIHHERIIRTDLSKLSALRRLTLRMVFPEANSSVQFSISAAISTITSPVFHEFVLEFTGPSYLYDCLEPDSCWACWDCNWRELDQILEEQFAKLGNFSMVFRMGEIQHLRHVQEHAETVFPLLASRGCVRFETRSLQITYCMPPLQPQLCMRAHTKRMIGN
ncbi:hypothetical protein BJ322DRAFT_1038211 [Thelephora terrestris]|uniref:F-box domain-containing protein n=1 Tax=Thelephora terrestris TaxID=56493 RepID=A0A9P6HMI8_9AGAM|nr:hypothetical protein BJ322DRAFT_1038211 [Thelephora terrestris]